MSCECHSSAAVVAKGSAVFEDGDRLLGIEVELLDDGSIRPIKGSTVKVAKAKPAPIRFTPVRNDGGVGKATSGLLNSSAGLPSGHAPFSFDFDAGNGR